MARLFISAAHKSSGKTTVSIGLCAAFAARGITVQPFKKGPDYIDPMWLARASGQPCFNLDFNTQTHDEIVAMVALRSRDADLALIEGNKGLHDGVDLGGSDCSAALAKLTRSPVVLVIDVLGMTRGIAPLLLGYQAFDKDVRIAGVILNKVGPARQEAKLRQAIEAYTDFAVLGAIPRDRRLAVTERHLGLMTPSEAPAAGAAIEAMRRNVVEGVDLDRLLVIANEAPELEVAPSPGRVTTDWNDNGGQFPCIALPSMDDDDAACSVQPSSLAGEGSDGNRRVKGKPHDDAIRIAIPRDAAFGFYYADDLEAFERGGAALSFFDTLSDARLPDADGLFIGGGFPETQAARLAANASLRADIARALRSGLPCYAECGGLMYLSRSIQWHGETHEMVGVIPADAVMHERPQGRGLVLLEETADFPWPRQAPASTAARIPAHEFHYAALTNLAPGMRFAFRMVRGTGIGDGHDGVVLGNVVAGFSHLRASTTNPWVERFMDFVRGQRATESDEEKGSDVPKMGAQPGSAGLRSVLGLYAEQR